MEKKYKKSGNMISSAVGGILMLIIGVAIANLVLIFTGVLAGQTYELTESDIDAITNTEIKNAIKNSVYSGFQAQEQTGKYLPLIVLGVIIFIVVGLVLSLTFYTGGNMGGDMRGSAL